MMILPWGKYRCKRLTIGVANLTDIFQQKMTSLFHRFEFIRAFIDELLILTEGYWKDNV